MPRRAARAEPVSEPGAGAAHSARPARHAVPETAPATAIAPRLLAWFGVHGRHDLPWQSERTPYSVWVSEVMLQQTQVNTVIPFYLRFIRRFPTAAALAAAPLDDVLSLWAGLGYYARGRNLWRAARIVAERHAGRLPETFAELLLLPGIGRSTAGAILAQALGARLPILDGNVKRVLARYHAVDGWPGDTAVQKTLWDHAELHTPHERVADYTQAIMDLGATLCTRARPACTVCPLATDCAACRSGTQAKYPAPRPKRARAHRRVTVLVVEDPEGRVLLERRPARGVWGGLYSLPELGAGETAAEWCGRELGAHVSVEHELATIEHTFTHFDLDLEPRLLRLAAAPAVVNDRDDRFWHVPSAELAVGIPAPVASLFRSLATGSAQLRPPQPAPRALTSAQSRR
jgi:A/G-specific adenine glycosylase